MVSESEVLNLIQEAKKPEKERKFTQALELYIVLKDIDVKKGFALNEVIELPKQMTQPAAICVMATGDMSLKAKSAKADQVIDNDELDTLAGNKRESPQGQPQTLGIRHCVVPYFRIIGHLSTDYLIVCRCSHASFKLGL